MELIYRHGDWREQLNKLSQEQKAQDLFRELMLVFNGDVEEAQAYLEENARALQQQFGFSPQDFQQQLRDMGLVNTDQAGSQSLSAKGSQHIRSSCLDAVFGRFKTGGGGEHHSKRQGGRGDRTGITRPWQPGDEASDIDYRGSLLNAFRRDDHLSSDDLIVEEREQSTSVATVMLIDISHSMTLYGEDRITPAKRVALAYAELQQRFYPRDALHILLFGDDVHEVSLAELPFISNGPFHTNTCAALERANDILSQCRQPQKRIIMITDGKPTALFVGGRDGAGARRLMINSSYGLDPEIVTATLNQGAKLRRAHIDLNVFMVASDTYLEHFVQRLIDVAGGQAFRATSSDLGAQVLQQIVAQRRR